MPGSTPTFCWLWRLSPGVWGLEPYGDSTGIVAEPDQDWRVPDQAYASAGHSIDQGLAGAELVVKIRSPGDESYEKLPFYAARSVSEVLIVHEDRRVELYRLRGDGSCLLADDSSGRVNCASLDVTFTTVEGPKLQIGWDGGWVEI